MVNVLKNLIGKDCYVFLDDLIVISRSIEEYTARLQNVWRDLTGLTYNYTSLSARSRNLK